MKTKLTLTVKKDIILSAKRIAKKKKISVSKLFEEMFEGDKVTSIKTPEQLAAKRLLDREVPEYPLDERSDKELIIAHIKKKYD